MYGSGSPNRMHDPIGPDRASLAGSVALQVVHTVCSPCRALLAGCPYSLFSLQGSSCRVPLCRQCLLCRGLLAGCATFAGLSCMFCPHLCPRESPQGLSCRGCAGCFMQAVCAGLVSSHRVSVCKLGVHATMPFFARSCCRTPSQHAPAGAAQTCWV